MEELSLVSKPEGRSPMKLKEGPVLGGDLEVVTNTLTMAEARVSAQAAGKLFCNCLKIMQGTNGSFCLQAVVFLCTELEMWLLCMSRQGKC